MSKSLLLIGSIVLLGLSLFVTPANADVAVIQQYYEYLRKTDQTLFAGNVFSQDTTRILHEASVALGTSDVANNFLNFGDSTVRMNGMGELLVSMAVMRLVQETVFSSLDTAIPTTFLPRGVQFYNPATPGSLLTLRHLLTHTSTLSDAKFEQFKKTSPEPVLTLRSFITAYFLQNSGGTYSVSPDVWFTGTPGSSTSFRYAKVNVALLAFIVEQAVVTSPSLVSTGADQTVATYIQEKILNPLGMSSTYLRNLDGSFPTLSYPPNTATFDYRSVLDYTSASTVLTQSTIHPAYVSDYMYYTNAMDIGRLMRTLFLDASGAWRTYGATLKDQSFSVLPETTATTGTAATTSSTTSTVLTGQTMQAQGVMFFDGAVMCAVAQETGVIEKCPLLSTSSIWGHMSVGQHSQTGTFCTDTVSSTNPTCVSATLSFYDTGSNLKSMNYMLGLAAVAFQEAIGDKSTVVEGGTSTDSVARLYPLWVAMGILGVIIFVVFASLITENLIQPAPVAGVPVPALPKY